jgi:hypothetical protein
MSVRPAGLTTHVGRCPRHRLPPSWSCCFRPAPPPQHVGARQEPTTGSVARLHGGSRRVGERVVRALIGGRDIVVGARAVCRARRRTLERGEGEKRPLLFIAQKVKKGDLYLRPKIGCLFDCRTLFRCPLHRHGTGREGPDLLINVIEPKLLATFFSQTSRTSPPPSWRRSTPPTTHRAPTPPRRAACACAIPRAALA